MILDRRTFLQVSAAALAAGSAATLETLTAAQRSGRRLAAWRPRYSICSELFEGWSVERVAPVIGKLGYTGLEIAPFWLEDHVDKVSPARRREIKRVLADHNVVVSGLHWLLITPPWLHVTTPDEKVRNDSWDYVLKLIDLCADLDGKIMVFGSPKQRTSKGIPARQAVTNLVEGFKRIAPHAASRGVVICMEPIPTNQNCDVVNTMAQAAGVVARVGHSSIQSMYDVHNTSDETLPADLLIARHAPIIRHIHINEMDGGYPGSRDYDFKPLFRALRKINYQGWTSVEVFDFKPGAEKIASESIAFMKKVVAES